MSHNAGIVRRGLVLHRVLVLQPEGPDAISIEVKAAHTVVFVDLTPVTLFGVHAHPEYYRVTIRNDGVLVFRFNYGGEVEG